jgi:hypothetical protein
VVSPLVSTATCPMLRSDLIRLFITYTHTQKAIKQNDYLVELYNTLSIRNNTLAFLENTMADTYNYKPRLFFFLLDALLRHVPKSVMEKEKKGIIEMTGRRLRNYHSPAL